MTEAEPEQENPGLEEEIAAEPASRAVTLERMQLEVVTRISSGAHLLGARRRRGRCVSVMGWRLRPSTVR